MTKKSAAQFEVAGKKPKLPPIEKVFETQKKGMLATIEVQIKQDSRFDTLMAMRQSYERFFSIEEDTITIDEAKELASRVKMQHEKVRDIVESMTLEQITAEDFTNPCDALVDFDEADDWREVFEQSVFFSAIQPYGQAFDGLHGRMMEEVAKRA